MIHAADDAERKQAEMIAFMKNLSLMGTMLFLIANGSGPWSLSGPAAPAAGATADQVEEEE